MDNEKEDISHFDKRLNEVYKSLMIEADTADADTDDERIERDAAAIKRKHDNKSLARKGYEALVGGDEVENEVMDKYEQLQKVRKQALIPGLQKRIDHYKSMMSGK